MNSNSKLYVSIFFVSYLIGISIFNFKDYSRSPASKPITDVLKFRRSYLALDTDKIEIDGFGHVQGHDGKYIQRLFGEIIQKAHLYSAKDFYFPDRSIFLYYNTFLLNSLTVPFHESSLMHLTRRSRDYCYLANDFADKNFHQFESGAAFLDKLLDVGIDEETLGKKSLLSNPKDSILELWRKPDSETGKSIIYYLDRGFNQLYNFTTVSHDLFPACHKIETQDMIQIFFSSDYSDLGLYQISSEAHDEMISDLRIFNTLDTLNYGISYLYYGEKKNGGFRLIVRNPDDYECLEKNIRSTEYFKRVARGNWAGQFNSGRTSETCRFADSNNNWEKNDDGFYKSLNTILMDEDKELKSNIWLDYLPEDSIEKKAYLELVNNFKTRVNNREYLDQVLETDYSKVSLLDDPELVTSHTPVPNDRIEEREYKEKSYYHYVYENGMYVSKCKVPTSLLEIDLKKPLFVMDDSRAVSGDFIGPGLAKVVHIAIDEQDNQPLYGFFFKEGCRLRWLDAFEHEDSFTITKDYRDNN